MSKKNLLIFGCDFFREKKSSEINFWNDISVHFSHYFNEIVILSVNNRKVQQEMIGENIYLYNVQPCFLGNPGTWENSEYTGERFQKLPLSIAYKSYTFWRLQPTFDRIIERHRIGIVHYMRIFGLLNRILTRRYPEILFSITVPTHIDRGFPLHLFYHNIKNGAIKPMDRIIPTSEATRHKLIKLGLPPKKLKTIHWSSNVNDESPSASNIRNELALSEETQIILWSGPLQDANKKEFFFAHSVAKKVLEKTNRFSFVFAFKPCSLNSEYMKIDQDVTHIKILETDFNTFCALKREAILFLSPICNKNRTVAPAITWIEMMQLGLPVMTTYVDGVTELIKHGKTGFIVNSIDEAVATMLNFEITEQFREECRTVVKQKYNIKRIAEQYLNMWAEANKDLKKYKTNYKGRKMTTPIYEGKKRYQSLDVASAYDQIRFSNQKGKLTDKLEKKAIEKALKTTTISNGLVLDVPCGTGRMTELFLEKGFNVVAADISDAMMAHAIKRNDHFGHKVKFTKADVEKLNFEDNSFDVVLTIRLMHHIPPELHLVVLRELWRVTRRWVIITFSNKYSLQNIRRDLFSIFTKAPRYSISPTLFRQEVDQAGFDIIEYNHLLPLFSETVTVLLEKRVL